VSTRRCGTKVYPTKARADLECVGSVDQANKDSGHLGGEHGARGRQEIAETKAEHREPRQNHHAEDGEHVCEAAYETQGA
jgi:hypothetical protein